jgi:hypothetical protein
MPKNLGTAQEVSFSADPAHPVTRRFPPPWTVEELDACFETVEEIGRRYIDGYSDEQTALLPGRDS